MKNIKIDESVIGRFNAKFTSHYFMVRLVAIVFEQFRISGSHRKGFSVVTFNKISQLTECQMLI